MCATRLSLSLTHVISTIASDFDNFFFLPPTVINLSQSQRYILILYYSQAGAIYIHYSYSYSERSGTGIKLIQLMAPFCLASTRVLFYTYCRCNSEAGGHEPVSYP